MHEGSCLSQVWGIGKELHFSRFKNHPQPREHDNNEDKTIAQLAAIYFRPLEDDPERSLTEYKKAPEDPAKEEIDHHLNETPVWDPVSSKQYEVTEKKGDEEPPPPELKPLAKELRYEFLDATNKYPVIISANLSD